MTISTTTTVSTLRAQIKDPEGVVATLSLILNLLPPTHSEADNSARRLLEFYIERLTQLNTDTPNRA